MLNLLMLPVLRDPLAPISVRPVATAMPLLSLAQRSLGEVFGHVRNIRSLNNDVILVRYKLPQFCV